MSVCEHERVDYQGKCYECNASEREIRGDRREDRLVVVMRELTEALRELREVIANQGQRG